ncbi:MAG: hypothetical protein HYS57_00015 [Parcubacteria group bacterium]|nr:hypothetical protein [Parcubacteria group bacterium]
MSGKQAYLVTKTTPVVAEAWEANFEAVNDDEARKKFAKWFPGEAEVRYALYRLVDVR